MSTLYIIRGLPGSGKTTLARKLTKHYFAADDYFETETQDGKIEYKFDPQLIAVAHSTCTKNVEDALCTGEDVAVHNTFSQSWEAQPYFDLAEEYGYYVIVIECQSKFKSIHNVPQQVIDNMRSRWLPLQ